MRSLILAVLFFSGCASAAPQFIESNDGVKIYVRSIGRGSPIVVIHGGPGLDQGSLLNDLRPLSGTYRLIFYDQRGGGRSTLPDPSRLSIDDHVADLEALRVKLGLARLTILAHSFGPAIAAKYAIAHPEHVERMIFLGPIPPRKGTFFEDYGAELGRRLTPAQLARLTELSKVFEGSEGDAIAACREYWTIGLRPRLANGSDPSAVKSDLCTASDEAIRFGMARTNPATFGSLEEWNWNAELARVTAPVLIIHGEEDAIPAASVREWSTSLPNGRMLLLPGTGHFPHAEKPDIVFPAIGEFLRGGWPAGAAK